MALAALAVSLSACGGSEEKRGDRVFDGHGVSFRYPGDWRPIESEGLSAESGKSVWTEMFAPSSSSGADVVFISEYRTPKAITKKNRKANAAAVASTVAAVAHQAKGSLLAGPTEVDMGGLPGYDFEIRVLNIKDRPSTSRLILVWNGKTEFFLNCQHLTRGTLGAEIERGCKTIIRSFRLS